MKTAIIGHFGGYRKMYSFGWTCLIYHATTLFCRRNYNYKNDALGKTVGQMVGAARSARQNIVEASSRAATSKEQELKQLDVAKGSLDELAGDYEAFTLGGRWPRPRKPTAPRAAGHERALRATRNPPPPHVEARKRFAHLSTFNPLPTPFREMRTQCGILFRPFPRWLLPQRTHARHNRRRIFRTYSLLLAPYSLPPTCSFSSRAGRSAFVPRRAAWTLSCPAPAGFRERRTAPFRVRA